MCDGGGVTTEAAVLVAGGTEAFFLDAPVPFAVFSVLFLGFFLAAAAVTALEDFAVAVFLLLVFVLVDFATAVSAAAAAASPTLLLGDRFRFGDAGARASAFPVSAFLEGDGISMREKMQVLVRKSSLLVRVSSKTREPVMKMEEVMAEDFCWILAAFETRNLKIHSP